MPISKLSKERLYDKVLGMLVGSAIGDAMGAPTEMWSRADIGINYGFVDDLDTLVREPSAEGPWEYNLPAGGTTDDTRWKKLVSEFLLTQGSLPSDRDFADYTSIPQKLFLVTGIISLLSLIVYVLIRFVSSMR